MNQMPYCIPNENEVAELYRKSQLSKSGVYEEKAKFLKFLGPCGEKDWGSLPIGYTSEYKVFILPAPMPKNGGAVSNIYNVRRYHYWRSTQFPQGNSVNCSGANCLVCKARQLGLGNPDPNIQKRAKEWGKTLTKYDYQIVLLDYPNQHIGAMDGVMRPYILDASMSLHNAIGELILARGLVKIVDPMNGRPVLIKKVKTGPRKMDVEYKAMDLDPAPLPQNFYPIFNNLYDLSKFAGAASDEAMQKAVIDMGLDLSMLQPQQQPMIPNIPTAQVYQAPTTPMQAQQPMQNVAPVFPPQAVPVAPAPVPMTTAPSAQPQARYQMFPGQPMPQQAPVQMALPTQAMPQQAPMVMNMDTPRVLTVPVDGQLPGSREKCFSKPSDADTWCMDCKNKYSWIYQQCVQCASKPMQAENPALNELQRQLMQAANSVNNQ